MLMTEKERHQTTGKGSECTASSYQTSAGGGKWDDVQEQSFSLRVFFHPADQTTSSGLLNIWPSNLPQSDEGKVKPPKSNIWPEGVKTPQLQATISSANQLRGGSRPTANQCLWQPSAPGQGPGPGARRGPGKGTRQGLG